MDNAAGSSDLTLDLFGSLQTELGPTDLPQGLSPACQDVAFLPGSVSVRPSRKRIYSSLPAASVYHKTYVTPAGVSLNLFLCSNGKFYYESPLVNPGVFVQFGATAPGNRCISVTSNGKEYFAISDGNQGVDIPRQFDGTYFDRVSQDGPGAPPSVANYVLPSVLLAAGSTGTGITIVTLTPIDPQLVQVGGGNGNQYWYQEEYGGGGGGSYNPPQFVTYYTSLLVATAAPHGLNVGSLVAVTGATLYNNSYAVVTAVDSATTFELYFFSTQSTVGTGGSVSAIAPMLLRSRNTVTANTATAHNLQVGYQVQIQGTSPVTVGGAITSIVVDNESNPGLATVTMSAPHGLVPGNLVNISGVQNTSVGGGLATVTINSNYATVTTLSPHGLQVGSQIIVSQTSPTSTPYATTVQTVPSPTSIGYAQTAGNESISATGTVVLVWPLANATVEQTYFTVQQCPTATTFTVPLSSVDGTWSGGTVTFAWDGTYLVTAVPSSTTLQYAQPGPDATLSLGSATLTPLGQIAPGQHSLVCVFETREGYLTAPSPPTVVYANGGQYLTISNIPIGPPNVVARILALTGAGGSNYFYLPVPAMINGQRVSTSTRIADNTTTSALLDFSDNSLFAAAAIDIPGNNLFQQRVLGPCLGVFAYGSRMFWWGERNKLPNLINMGFDGGYYASAPTQPLGWTIETAGGALVQSPMTVDAGGAWQITGDGSANELGRISQNVYADGLGVAIGQPATQYTFHLWVEASAACTVCAEFYNASGVLATATIAAAASAGSFLEALFSALTPVTITPDTLLRVYAKGLPADGTVTLDETFIYYTANPYVKFARASYVNNPEAFDGVTGNIGPAADANGIRLMQKLRGNLYLVTSGPDGALYETSSSTGSEPASWGGLDDAIARKCGGISVWGSVTGETWFAWASDTGKRAFEGGEVFKISQEVETLWEAITSPQLVVMANDTINRRVYTVGQTAAGAFNYVMDYRELTTASQIDSNSPVHVSLSGKVISTDIVRKWTTWSQSGTFVGNLTLPDGSFPIVFSGANAYKLMNDQLGLDDDSGLIPAFYTTYFFAGSDDEAAKQIGSHRKMFPYLALNGEGVGQLQVTPYVNSLGNAMVGTPWMTLALAGTSQFDLECGLNVLANRAAFRIAGQPASAGAPSWWQISKLIVSCRPDLMTPVRGAF
jgi:hypothetical protein